MKNFRFSIFFGLIASLLLVSCSDEDDNYKSFSGPQEALLFNKSTSVFEFTAAAPAFTEVLVSSTTVSNVDRVVPVVVSPFTTATTNMYSIDMSTAVIPAGQTTAKLKINSGSFAALPSDGSARQLVLVFGPNFYALPNRTNHVVSIQRGCANTKVNLNILFDAYASEISWLLRNSANVTVASSSPYADGLGSFTTQFCLTPGNYTFIMNDSWGDGIAPGSYNLKLTNGTTLVSGSVFGSTISHPFTIN
ncbi:hypothetical protein [Flavobacterium sp.]|jgi:hypothetical protein|uniref:hypothetical protein n=1 Tax=Flavobacterium sp. TaxID=239 RepID=UPI0037BF95C6